MRCHLLLCKLKLNLRRAKNSPPAARRLSIFIARAVFPKSTMKAKLHLTSPLWKTPERRAILDKAVQQSGAELESAIKQKILDSVPSGKLYRRGGIKRQIAKRDLGFFRSRRRVFKRSFTGLYAEKTTVGYQFHRASKRGQPPANDTGNLLNSIRASKIGFLSVRVATAVRYAVRLDSTQGLDRPFFARASEEFKPKFKQNIREAIAENS